MRLWHGATSTLAHRSARLAETLGNPRVHNAGTWVHRAIAERIVEQYDKHTAQFDAFLVEDAWEQAILDVAAASGMHPYSLVYGLPQHVIEAVHLTGADQLMCVIQLGDMEPHILSQLVLCNDGEPLDARSFDPYEFGRVPTTYEARDQVTRRVVGGYLNYAMMLSGATLQDIAPAHDDQLAACMMWGIPVRYASLLLQQGSDPLTIRKLYEQGIDLEYASSLSPA